MKQTTFTEQIKMAYKIKIKKKEKKIPKTREVFVVQGNYGSGWEDVTEETSWYGGKNRLREYRDNVSYPHRLIRRRVPYFKLSKMDEDNNKEEFNAYLERTKKAREERKAREKNYGIQS